MANELRLAMAMGGGVSLGTFSGAALTQAIKLLVIESYYHQKYNKITIDAFSGASAGAMSLGIMLRGLALYNSQQLADAEISLKDDLGNDAYTAIKNALSTDQWNDLLVIQAVQDLQKEIWVDTINIWKLLGIEPTDSIPTRRLKKVFSHLEHQPSLFLRETLEKIATKHFDVRNTALNGSIDYSKRRLLAERVLFGCTLTNLSPILHDAIEQHDVHDSGLIGLRDGLRSFSHRDMRVFDINFRKLTDGNIDDNINFPDRWYRCDNDLPNTDKKSSSLQSNEAWSVIAATTLACGCFPYAFEPVELKRRRWEYGNNKWPKQIEELAGRIGKDDILSANSFPFSYVDGGVFNNEPIREAFRLAYFMDNVFETQNSYDRRILFVDPNVGEQFAKLGVSYLDHLKIGKDYDFENADTLSRLPKFSIDLAGTLTNQSTVNEADKIFQKRDEIVLRKEYRKRFADMELAAVAADDLKKLAKDCIKKLTEKKEKDQLPSVQVNIRSELLRIINEDPDNFGNLTSQMDDFLNFISGDADPAPGNLEIKDWYKVLMLSHLDIMIDMEGIDENARILSISPFKIELDDNGKVTGTEPIQRFGHTMSGFAGFFSRKARDNDFENGKWAALHFLGLDNKLDSDDELYQNLTRNGDPKYKHTPDDVKAELKENSFIFERRISHIIGRKGRLGSKVFKININDLINEQLVPDHKTTIQIRITGLNESFGVNYNTKRYVPLSRMRDSKQISLRQGVSPTHTVAVKLQYDLENKKWTGSFIDEENQSLQMIIKRYSMRWKKNPIVNIPLPEDDFLEKLTFNFKPILTLDLSNDSSDKPQFNSGEKTTIDNPEWNPRYHIVPIDNEALFEG